MTRRRYCGACSRIARKKLPVQHAVCGVCAVDTCAHLIRFSNPRVICGSCAAVR